MAPSVPICSASNSRKEVRPLPRGHSVKREAATVAGHSGPCTSVTGLRLAASSAFIRSRTFRRALLLSKICLLSEWDQSKALAPGHVRPHHDKPMAP
jgi:hypothetical protein